METGKRIPVLEYSKPEFGDRETGSWVPIEVLEKNVAQEIMTLEADGKFGTLAEKREVAASMSVSTGSDFRTAQSLVRQGRVVMAILRMRADKRGR